LLGFFFLHHVFFGVITFGDFFRGYIGFDAFEEIMIQRYAAQDPMDEIRKAFDAWLRK